ncbi:MAG: prepilin peptidase [Rhizobiales bacterium]|nr:prepilin peptidase [Hyphomicrobiales bacterium]
MPGRGSPAPDVPFVLKWWDYAACLAAAALSIALLPLPLGAFAAALGALAVLIAIIDIDRFIIPDAAGLAMLILGLALVAMEDGDSRTAALVDAGLRALATGGALFLLRAGYRRLAGVDGLGLGDVKLAAAAGPWLMWPTLPFAIAVAAVAALITTGVRAMVLGQRVHLKQELPFGAFLAPAIWISFLIERLWLLPV